MTNGPSPTFTAPALGPPVRGRGNELYDRIRAVTWTARGITKVVGTAEMGVGDLDGTVVVGDSLSALRLSVRGSLDVGGTLAVTEELRTHGTLRAVRGVTARSARFEGIFRAEGPVAVTEGLEARGLVSAPTLTAGRAHLSGTVTVPGEVRASAVVAELENDSTIGLLKGRSVKVVGPDGALVDRVFARSRAARVDRIEADTVELERVEVGHLVAREVVLGRHCHVRTLEAGQVRTHPTSRVGPESRTPPPLGLRR